MVTKVNFATRIEYSAVSLLHPPICIRNYCSFFFFPFFFLLSYVKYEFLVARSKGVATGKSSFHFGRNCITRLRHLSEHGEQSQMVLNYVSCELNPRWSLIIDSWELDLCSLTRTCNNGWRKVWRVTGRITSWFCRIESWVIDKRENVGVI